MNVHTKPQADSKTTEALPQRLHHYAVVIKDQEANRVFWEDVIGIPLGATWCEVAYNATLGREIEYCHTFYPLADGGALAFFQYADEDAYQALKPDHVEKGQHFSMKVDRPTYDRIAKSIQAHKYPFRETDHGYCLSIYTATPEGLKIEFTIDHPEVDQINAMRKADCHKELKRWLAGDHRPNNHDRHGVTA